MIDESTTAQSPRPDQEPIKVGAIDMGSKNFKFVFGQKINGNITTELIRKERLELGKEVTGNHGIIGHKKFRQIEEALSQFVRYCQDRGAPTVLAISTSAIRNARNHKKIVDLAHEIGISMEIAEGAREGEVGYFAATGGVPNKLISDAGSRSIQIAWEINGHIVSHSTPVGYEQAYESFVEHAFRFLYCGGESSRSSEILAFKAVLVSVLSWWSLLSSPVTNAVTVFAASAMN